MPHRKAVSLANRLQDTETDESTSDSDGEVPEPIPHKRASPSAPRKNLTRHKYFNSDDSSSHGPRPQSMPSKKVPTSKPTHMLRGMNPDNVVTTPTRKTRTTTMHPVEQREAPVSGQRNRQRTGRRDHGPVNYNTDQHPADEAIFGSSEDEEDEEDGSKSVRKSSAGGSDTDDDDDGIEVLSPSQGRIKQRTPRQPSPYYPRTHRVAQIPDTDENETGSDEDIERPQTARANAKEISKDNDDRQPDLELRRSSGRAANRVPVNYNLKVHPDYDKACRPAAYKAAQSKSGPTLSRKKSVKGVKTKPTVVVEDGSPGISLVNNVEVREPQQKLSLSGILSIAIPPLADKSRSDCSPVEGKKPQQSKGKTFGKPRLASISSRSSFGDQYSKRRLADFNTLTDLQRHLFLLQQGASPYSNTLPLTWERVKQILFEHGEITLDDLNSPEGTEWIKKLYDDTRQAVQAFFTSKNEPIDKRDWTILYTEGFNVFDKAPNTKYWKHYKDSIVQPVNSAADSAQHRADTEATHVEESVIGGLPCREEYIGGPIRNNVAGTPSELNAASPSIDFKWHSPDDEEELPGGPSIDQLMQTLENRTPLFEAIMNTQESDNELDELLRPFQEHLSKGTTTSNIDTNHLSADFMSSLPTMRNASEIDLLSASHIPSTGFESSTPTLQLRSEGNGQNVTTSVNSIEHGLQYEQSLAPLATVVSPSDLMITPDPRTATTPTPKLKTTKRKRRGRNEDETVRVREDSPGKSHQVKKQVANNPRSPGTDVPKENQQAEGAVDYSSDVDLRSPQARRRLRVVNSQQMGRVLFGHEDNVSTPLHHSLFGGPLGQISPES